MLSGLINQVHYLAVYWINLDLANNQSKFLAECTVHSFEGGMYGAGDAIQGVGQVSYFQVS